LVLITQTELLLSTPINKFHSVSIYFNEERSVVEGFQAQWLVQEPPVLALK
jgi:hypothetical protein